MALTQDYSMKSLIWLIIIFSLSIINGCQAQHRLNIMETSSNEVLHLEYGNVKGVIFSKFYRPKIELGKIRDRFTPNSVELLAVEELLNQYKKDNSRSGLKKLSNYARQYIGYTDDAGGRFIIVQLLNLVNSRNEPSEFNNWKYDYIVGMGDFYEKNTKRYIVNLEKNTISIF
jgi:hypothetical protein